jgi:ABC-type branched-subunit amino acid transport system ATPase component
MSNAAQVLPLNTPSPSVLSVSDLRYQVKDSSILCGVSFSVSSGETVGIIGPNGSGKTSLFNCISGFATPSGGSVTFRGEDITKLSPFTRARRGLGRVFQNFGIFRDMTVLENVVLALEAHEPAYKTLLPWGRAPKRLRDEAMTFLREVGLEGKASALAGSLSGGQMRLLEIIRTVAFRAELCLLDEPTAGVSPKMKDGVADLVRKLQQMGKTVLIIEHDIHFIQRFCDRIVVLDSGRIVLDDSPEKVRDNKMLQEIYFGAAMTGDRGEGPVSAPVCAPK